MSKPKSNSELDSLVQAIEQLDGEIADLRDSRKEYLNEAKAKGYPPKTVNAIITRRRKDRDEVLQADEELRNFELELGMRVLE